MAMKNYLLSLLLILSVNGFAQNKIGSPNATMHALGGFVIDSAFRLPVADTGNLYVKGISAWGQMVINSADSLPYIYYRGAWTAVINGSTSPIAIGADITGAQNNGILLAGPDGTLQQAYTLNNGKTFTLDTSGLTSLILNKARIISPSNEGAYKIPEISGGGATDTIITDKRANFNNDVTVSDYKVNISKPDIGTEEEDAIVLENPTPATDGSPTQYSPNFVQKGTGSDGAGGASAVYGYRTYVAPNGALGRVQLWWEYTTDGTTWNEGVYMQASGIYNASIFSGTQLGVTNIFTSSFAASIVTKTGSYNITTSDYTVLANTTDSNISLTLPNVAQAIGMVINIKKIAAANTLTIVGTVDGATNPTVTTNNEVFRVQSNGSTWYKL